MLVRQNHLVDSAKPLFRVFYGRVLVSWRMVEAEFGGGWSNHRFARLSRCSL